MLPVAAVAVLLLAVPGAFAGSFTRTGDLNTPRAEAISVKLADGRVLVAGGIVPGGETSRSAEIYDPATGTFTLVPGQMAVKRVLGRGVLLANGKVLIVGGQDGGSGGAGPRDTAELFDPATGTFTNVSGPMTTDRVWPLLTRLDSGKVLVSHGCCGGWNTAELYDPDAGPTGSFTPTTGQPDAGFSNATGTATRLANGRVLIAGDWSGRGAQVYDPATDTFTTTPGLMVIQRTVPSAALLDDGKVLIAGADDPNGATAELFDPATGTFSATAGTMSAARSEAYSARLPDGRVLIAGGSGTWGGTATDTTDIYDPATGTFSPGPTMAVPRRQIGVSDAIKLNDGRILFAGGALGTDSSTNPIATAISELYVPDASSAPGGEGGDGSPTIPEPDGAPGTGSPKGPAATGRMRVASGGSRLPVRIRVPGPGQLIQSGILVGARGSQVRASAPACRTSVSVTRARTVRIGCRLSSSTVRRLQRSSVRLRVTVSFTPTGSSAQSLSRTVRLARTTPSFTG